MIKKNIQYVDPFTEESETMEAYFHLTKHDMLMMEARHKGGYQAYLMRIVDAKDGPTILNTFSDLIGQAYGIRFSRADGSGDAFIKDQARTLEFLSSEAFSELLMELATDANAGAEFVNGLFPKQLREQVEQFKKDNPDKVAEIEAGATNVFDAVPPPSDSSVDNPDPGLAEALRLKAKYGL